MWPTIVSHIVHALATLEAFQSHGCFANRYRPLVFKGCDDHILNLIHAAFNRHLVAYAKAKEDYAYLAQTTMLGNAYGTPYLLLKTVSHRLRTTTRP